MGLAAAASRTTNPVLLGLVLVVACLVVAGRRGDASWALGFRYYLLIGAVVVGLRVGFRVVFGTGGIAGGHVLLWLPQVPLPTWAAGIHLFGPVTAESVLAGLYDGLRLATMLVCLGAANSLANPRRLLACLPSALYEVGTAAVVALSVAPQLVDGVLRVRRARRLRGATGRGPRAVRAVVVPVLEDALDRSRALAAAMDSRGYGRTRDQPRSARRLTAVLLIGGLGGVCVGVYGLLDASTPRLLGGPVLAVGLGGAAVALWFSGRRVSRTRYRPDVWGQQEWVLLGCGVAAVAGAFAAGGLDPGAMAPSLDPLTWPQLPIVAAVGVLLCAVPALAPGAGTVAGTAVRSAPEPAAAHLPGPAAVPADDAVSAPESPRAGGTVRARVRR